MHRSGVSTVCCRLGDARAVVPVLYAIATAPLQLLGQGAHRGSCWVLGWVGAGPASATSPGLAGGTLSSCQHPEHQQAGILLLSSVQQLVGDTHVICKGQGGWEGGATFPALSPG